MTRINVGDTIRVHAGRYTRAGGAYGGTNIRVEANTTLVVTRVYRDQLIARGPIIDAQTEASVYVSNVVGGRDITHHNNMPADLVETGPRRLGVKPEDTAELTHIGLDHPGIQWLFRDMGAYANEKGWCRTYDDLASDLGIPPRETEWNVSRTVDGVFITATINAVTMQQAEDRLTAMLVTA